MSSDRVSEGTQPSLAGRAVSAIFLLIGFYVLVIAVAALMIAAPFLEWKFAHTLHLQLAFLAFGGVLLLWALVPRPAKWADPGVAFDAQSQPELWAMVERVAAQTDQKPPAHAYLLDEVNAFVVNRGGVLGIGGSRALGIGVPLMMLLDEQELESVVAHEFGHFYGGDTKLGPLVYATRGAIGRALAATSSGAIHALFKSYASFYLRRTQSVSRAQELSADQLAGRVTSPATTASALARVEVGAGAFNYYLRQEYFPVVEGGRLPPYMSGFLMTLHSSTARDHLETAGRIALGNDAGSSFDSHPSTADRIRALGCDPATIPLGWHERPSAFLVRDQAGVEAQLVRRQLRVAPESLPPVQWGDVVSDVLVPLWRAETAERLLPVCADMLPTGVPVNEDELADFGDYMFRAAGRTANRADRIAVARVRVARYLMLAAIDAGWTLTSSPGEPLELHHDGRRCSVIDDWQKVIAGQLAADEWRRSADACGLRASVREVADSAGASAPSVLAATPASAAAPSSFRAAPAGGRRQTLVIDGPVATWGTQSVHADEVTSARYGAHGRTLEAQCSTASGDLHFKLKVIDGQKKQQGEAWWALVRWSERYVQSRLVDALIDRIRRDGFVQIGEVRVQPDGIVVGNTMTSWRDIAGIDPSVSEVLVSRRADNIDRRQKLASVSTMVDGAVLLPELSRALVALAPNA